MTKLNDQCLKAINRMSWEHFIAELAVMAMCLMFLFLAVTVNPKAFFAIPMFYGLLMLMNHCHNVQEADYIARCEEYCRTYPNGL